MLQVLRLLLEHPEGVRADRVAAEVGKSRSTAYHLLASLCDEGFAERLEGGLLPPLPARRRRSPPPRRTRRRRA